MNLKTLSLPAGPACQPRRPWRYPPLNALIGGTLLAALVSLALLGVVWTPYDPLKAVTYVVLPIITLTLVEFGAIARMARASTIEVLRLEYIAHARAKGLSESAVLWKHALRNAFAPTWTLIGLILGNLLGGIAVLETVFTLPGIGRLMVDAIFSRDYPVLQGCLLLVTCIYVLVNLLVDLLYPLFDPRVKL